MGSVENETGFSTGWKVNRVDGMAEAGADAETAEVRTLLYKSFDLNCRRGTKTVLFEQAFFWRISRGTARMGAACDTSRRRIVARPSA